MGSPITPLLSRLPFAIASGATLGARALVYGPSGGGSAQSLRARRLFWDISPRSMVLKPPSLPG